MAHVHTVLVTLRDPATAARCRERMESMRGRIDGMLDMRVVANELAGSYSADLALTTVWRDLAAYRAYEGDPVHLEVREVVLELMSSATTIDYTTGDDMPVDDTTGHDTTIDDTTGHSTGDPGPR